MNDSDALFEFEKYIENSIGYDDKELVKNVLWEYPRPLMTEVIPTILRRLETNWGQNLFNGKTEKEDHTNNSPLPEFIPSTLFGELNLPEVEINVPINDTGDYNQIKMPIFQALKTFSPGRVSKRFSVDKGKESHWLILEIL